MNERRRTVLRHLTGLAAFGATAGAEVRAAADTWPSRPVRLVVASTAGSGSTDFVARLIGPKLAAAFGQPFVVDNKAGAGGNIAAEIVARSPADGYTLLVAATSHSTNVNLYPRIGYDPIKDFAPITVLNKNHFGLAVASTSTYQTFADLVTQAKARSGKLNFATAGTGQANHLGTELLKSTAGFDAMHVPYKSMGEATTALLGGQVDFCILSLSSALPQAKAGKLRILAVTSQRRSALLPDVPTIAESGYPGYELSGWQALLAPAGTPREIIERVYQEVAKALKQADVQAQLANVATEPIGITPQEFAVFLQTEIVKWEKVIRLSGAKAE